MIELSREVVETIHENAKLVNRINDLEIDLEGVRSVKRLAGVNSEVALARMKTLDFQVKAADAKYGKTVDQTTQTEENFRSRTTVLKPLLRAERDYFAQLENNCADKVAGDKDVLADRPGASDAKRS